MRQGDRIRRQLRDAFKRLDAHKRQMGRCGADRARERQSFSDSANATTTAGPSHFDQHLYRTRADAALGAINEFAKAVYGIDEAVEIEGRVAIQLIHDPSRYWHRRRAGWP